MAILGKMRAVILDAPGRPLRTSSLPDPTAGVGELVLDVKVCAVCRTDLHIVDGDLTDAHFPLVLGHQIVGQVREIGPDTPPGASTRTGATRVDRPRHRFAVGDRVGVPWLGHTCGTCPFCLEERENLCDAPTFTGYHRNGGFAERAVADAQFCFHLPDGLDDTMAAPLLCGGLIGWRALRLAGEGRRIGLYGFGSSAHQLAQVLRHQGREAYAFVRPGDEQGIRFAFEVGAHWAGGSDERPPQPLDAALIFAPLGTLVPVALQHVRKGGTVVCAGIHMSDIPSFPYRWLWEERSIRSVANLTRRDGDELLALAGDIPIRSRVTTYPLEDAQHAMDDLRQGQIKGTAVLVVG